MSKSGIIRPMAKSDLTMRVSVDFDERDVVGAGTEEHTATIHVHGVESGRSERERQRDMANASMSMADLAKAMRLRIDGGHMSLFDRVAGRVESRSGCSERSAYDITIEAEIQLDAHGAMFTPDNAQQVEDICVEFVERLRAIGSQ